LKWLTDGHVTIICIECNCGHWPSLG